MFCKTITENSGKCNKRRKYTNNIPKTWSNTNKKQFVNLLTTAIFSIVCKLFSPPAETRWEHWTTRERERASYTFEERILNLYFLRFCTYTDIFAIVTKHKHKHTQNTRRSNCFVLLQTNARVFTPNINNNIWRTSHRGPSIGKFSWKKKLK